MKQAKIQISADVSALKQQVNQAKQTIEGLNSVKINPKSMNAIKEAFGKELDAAIDNVTKKLEEANKALENMNAKGVPKISKEFGDATKNAEALTAALKEAVEAKKKLQTGEINVGKGPGLMGKLQGGAMKAAGAIGLGLGIAGTYNHAQEMAKQRIKQRQLTGGSQVDENSPFAFTTDERRERAVGIAKAAGRDISSGELTGLTNLSEGAERAFGIEQETTNESFTQARKAGSDEQKLVMGAMGAAVANGLEGSRIGEYLSSMNSFMAEMADSITVSPDSINGFAKAFGDNPFFKNDPSRLFGQMRGMDAAFKGGDRFQQAQAARAILKSNGGASPAEIELRRSLGLFGNSKALTDRISTMKGGKELNKTMSISGTDIMNNMLEETLGATKDMKLGEKMNAVMSRLGLQGEGGQMVAADIIDRKKISQERIIEGQMSPEEQLKYRMQENQQKSLAGVEGELQELAKDITKIKDSLGKDLGVAVTGMATALDKIAEFFGISDGAKAAATGITAGAGAYAASKLGGKTLAQKAMSSTAGQAVKGGAGKVLGKVAGAAASKAAIPLQMMWSEDVGAGSDVGINDSNSYDAFTESKKHGMAPAGTAANIPFAKGFNSTEQNAAKNFSPLAAAVKDNPSALELPDVMKTVDPEAVSVLKGIYQVLSTGRGPQASNRMPSGVGVLSQNNKVGK